jgi:hypothetical protein
VNIELRSAAHRSTYSGCSRVFRHPKPRNRAPRANLIQIKQIWLTTLFHRRHHSEGLDDVGCNCSYNSSCSMPPRATHLSGMQCNNFILMAREYASDAPIGISIYSQDGTDAETLVAHASAALYRTKAEERIRLFEPTMDLKFGVT